MKSGFDYAGLKIADKAKGFYAEKGKNYDKETPLKDSAETYSAGAIYATTADLLKWHLALQHGQFINKKSLDLAYFPITKTYGYGWMIDSLYGRRIVAHSGGFWGFRSNFARITEDNVCIILLSNNEVTGLDMITKGLIAVLYDQPYQLPKKKKAVRVSEDILKNYVGTYEIAEQHLVMSVKLENGSLNVYPVNGPRSELLALDNTHFFDSEQESIELIFTSDEKQPSLTINMNGNKRVAIKKS